MPTYELCGISDEQIVTAGNSVRFKCVRSISLMLIALRFRLFVVFLLTPPRRLCFIWRLSVSSDKEELITFLEWCASGSGPRNLWRILRQRKIGHFSTLWLVISLVQSIGCSWKCYQRCVVGQGGPTKIWKLSGSGLRIRTGSVLVQVCAFGVLLLAREPHLGYISQIVRIARLRAYFSVYTLLCVFNNTQTVYY